MKTILMVMLLIPTLIFGQVSSWRHNGGNVSSQPRISTPQSQFQQPNNISSWRNNPPVERNSPIQMNRGRVENYSMMYNPISPFPYFGVYGWYNPMSYYGYDAYGYRYRNHIYVYENGRRDTIKVEPIHYSFGVQTTNDKQIGGWLSIGNRGYFIVDYSCTNINDKSTYFPYGQIQNADFPIIGDVKNVRTFYVGIGKKIDRTGFHVMVGNINEDVRYKGKDAIGLITFPNYKSNYISAKIGLLHDFKIATIKLDYDPFTKVSTYGIGVNL